MGKIHKLTQDNGSCNNAVGFSKYSVEIYDSNLVMELKKFFRWRKDVGAERLYKQGSHKYDLFIKYLYEKGY
jgi:hypothetical protein